MDCKTNKNAFKQNSANDLESDVCFVDNDDDSHLSF